MAKAATTKMVVLDLHDKLRRQWLPFGRTVRCPTAWSTWRLPREARSLNQGFQLGSPLFPLGLV